MRRILTAAALIAGIALATAGDTANAGIAGDSVTIQYSITGGANALTAAQGLEAELWEDGVTDASALCSSFGSGGDANSANAFAGCNNLSDASYTIGATSIDGYYVSNVFCSDFNPIPAKPFDEPGATFTHTAGQSHSCFVFLVPVPPLFVDVIVDGGPAALSDFEIEVYDSDGGAIVATATDPSTATCDANFPNGTDCGQTALPSTGTFFLGSSDVAGYVPSGVICNSSIGGKQFDAPTGQFTHAPQSDATVCTVTMTYVTQTVSADIEVVNDSDGTATGADFTIEIYDVADVLVASGVDPEPGTGNASFEAVLPAGDYTFGIEGPEGYDTTIAVTAVPVGGNEKIIEDASAAFTVSESATASAVLTADDQAAPATTAVATTAGPTTVAPTTPTVATTEPAPATTVDPNGTVLPATGPSSTTPLMLLGLGLLLIGSGVVAVTRRR